jgi:hypothetical protein
MTAEMGSDSLSADVDGPSMAHADKVAVPRTRTAVVPKIRECRPVRTGRVGDAAPVPRAATGTMGVVADVASDA